MSPLKQSKPNERASGAPSARAQSDDARSGAEAGAWPAFSMDSSTPSGAAHILQLQRIIGNRAAGRLLSGIVQRQSSGRASQAVQWKEPFDTDAKDQWDSTVDMLIDQMGSEYGEDLSIEQVEYYLEAECGIENPRSGYFELDDESEYASYLSELQSVDVDDLNRYYFESAEDGEERDSEEEAEDVSKNSGAKEEDVSKNDGVKEEEEEEEEDPLTDILALLDTIDVRVQPNYGREIAVNLGKYFRNPRNFGNVTLLALRQEVELLRMLEETMPSPDPDRLTAFHWVLQELYIPPLKKGGGGGGNLSVKMNSDAELSVSGRPGFEKNAMGLPGMKTGYHRRHIVAWHTLAKAIQNLINRLLKLQAKDEGMSHAIGALQQLAAKLQAKEQADAKPDSDSSKQDTAKQDVAKQDVAKQDVAKQDKGKAPLPMGPTTDAKDLCVLVEHILSKLNSNILNLWPGDGYENSLINTYQSMFRLWAKECTALGKDQISGWKAAKQSDIQSRIDAKKGKFAAVVGQFSALLAAWQPEEDSEMSSGLQLSEFLLACADSFEVDYPYSEDRQGFEPGQQISSHILGLAGTLLRWADNDEEAFKGKNLSELVVSFEAVLNEFMFPPESGKLGKPDGKAPAKGTIGTKGTTGALGKSKSPSESEPAKVWDRERLEGSGVPNPGNTCYIASVMQLVLTIPQYRNLFMNNLREEVYSNVIYEVIRTGRALLVAMNSLTTSVEQVTAFRTALIRSGWLGGRMEDAGAQQDAGELITFILDLLDNTERAGRHHQWRDRGSLAGPSSEHTRDPVVNLSGIRFSGEGRSIEDLLAHNLSPVRIESEQLDNGAIRDHNWRLEGNLPNVLTLQLNRFSFSTILGRALKLKEKVTVGATLVIPTALTPDGSAVNYRLSSFIVHSGESPGGGHYVTYSRRGDDWYLGDDAAVSKVTTAEVGEKVKEAYILTYEKQ